MKQKLLVLNLVLLLVMGLVTASCARAPAPTPAPTVTATVTAPPATVTATPAPAPMITATVTAPPTTITATPTPTPAPPPVTPKMITWATYEIGTGEHLQASLVAETIYAEYGTRVRLIPTALDTGKIILLSGRSVDTSSMASALWYTHEGLDAFAERDFGPQPIQALRIAQHPGFPFVVRGDSRIQTLRDLKGARLGLVPGTAQLAELNQALLAFAGLTLADVEQVEFPSYSAYARAGMEGKIDAAAVNVSGAIAREWEAMPTGMRYLELPAADTEGWKRLKSVTAMYVPFRATYGPGISKDKTKELMTYPGPALVSYEWLDEDTAYFITKALNETYQKYAAKDQSLQLYWTLDTHWTLFDSSNYPLHKGAIRYYREIGQWTTAREARNKELLARQAKLRSLWDAVVDEATSKKIAAKDFSAFWLKKRTEAGF